MSVISGYLTVGLASVSRSYDFGVTYLKLTLDSIINTTTEQHKKYVVVVVFLADRNLTYNSYVHNILHSTYHMHIMSGFIRIVEADPRIYPKMKNIKKNFGDTQQRVLWRAKQVLDFAFMFSYCKDISEYYIQIEDDVECADHFVDGIRNFIWDLKSQNQSWALLEFSVLGFIGKLVKSADLDRFTDFLLLFYEEEPVDWLITPFSESMAQMKPIIRKPTLFQHWGSMSSYSANKNRHEKDIYFRSDGGLTAADNPPATVYTSLKVYKYNIKNVYGPTKTSEDIFWAKPPKDGDHITLVLNKPHPIDSIFIYTGDKTWQHDTLKSGVIEASVNDQWRHFVPGVNQTECGNFTKLGEITSGTSTVPDVVNKMKKESVRCIRVLMKFQNEKVIIRKIILFQQRGRQQVNASPFKAMAKPFNDTAISWFRGQYINRHWNKTELGKHFERKR